MQRILAYTLDDIRYDAPGTAGIITQTCQDGNLRLAGVCQTEDRVYFTLIPHDLSGIEDYVIVPVDDPETNALKSDLCDRWSHGYRAISLIRLESWSYLAVYAREISASRRS
jgi:hypothetical protein